MSVQLPFDGLDLMAYANDLSSGFLKPWKANGMAHTLGVIPTILQDEERLDAYLRNCMEMEGFTSPDIQRVKDWIVNQIAEEV